LPRLRVALEGRIHPDKHRPDVCATPRGSGGPKVDFRFRGNDVIFDLSRCDSTSCARQPRLGIESMNPRQGVPGKTEEVFAT